MHKQTMNTIRPRENITRKQTLFSLLFVLLLTGCQSFGVPNDLYREGLPGTANWAVLPFANYTDTDIASTQVERILMVMLPSNGVDNAQMYPEFVVTSANSVLADAHKIRNGRQWAQQNQVSFAFSGSVDQWGIGGDGRPEVALSLLVTDIRSDESLWSVSGSGQGQPGEDMYAVSRRLINDLLATLPVNRRL